MIGAYNIVTFDLEFEICYDFCYLIHWVDIAEIPLNIKVNRNLKILNMKINWDINIKRTYYLSKSFITNDLFNMSEVRLKSYKICISTNVKCTSNKSLGP